MSVFAQAAQLISTLLGMSQRGAGLGLDLTGWDSTSPTTESNAASLTSGVGDLGSFALAFGAKPLSRALVSAGIRGHAVTNSAVGQGKTLQQAADIIAWTITVVDILALTTGFGTPNDGAEVKAGSEQFVAAIEQLKLAIPVEHWKGDAAQAYADKDITEQEIAQKLADLDVQLAAIIKDQGDWVTHMRLGFGVLKDVLFAALVIHLLLMFAVPPPAGAIAAKVFAITVCVLGIAAALSFLGVLIGYSVENGNKANDLAADYAAQVQRAQSLTTPAPSDGVAAKVATAEESTVSGFDTIAASVPGTTGTASSAGPGTGVSGDRDTSDARTTEDETPGRGSPEAPAAPQTPGETMPSAPGVATPTLAQLAAASGQSAQLSGRVSRPEDLVKRAIGRVQQLASTAQQSRGAAESAEGTGGAEAAPEEAVLVGAAGAETAGRAPLDAAAVASEQRQEPGRVGRDL